MSMPSPQKRWGFTLVESILTIMLVTALLFALFYVFMGGLRTAYFQTVRRGAKGEMSVAMINLAKELRQAVSVTAAQAGSVTFTLDSDDNGQDETLQYVWSGSSANPLNRTQSFPSPSYTVPVVQAVSNLSFSYYDSSNTLLSFPVTASQVRAVAADMTVSNLDETFHLRSEIKLRCL